MPSPVRHPDALQQRIFEVIGQGLVVHAADGSIIECNRAAETILGLSRDQITGRTSLDPRWRAIHEDGSPFPGDNHPAMITLRTGQSVRGILMGVYHPDDNLRWIEICSEPLTDASGQLEAVVATFTDITDKYRMSQSLLLASQQFAQATLDSMDAQVCVINHAGQVVSVNEAWRQCTLRYATDHFAMLEGGDYLALCERTATPEQPVLIQLLAGLREILAGQRQRFQMEYDYFSDGQQRWYYTEISSFTAAGETFHMVLHKDITEHRQLMAQLAQAQKMDSLGRLAGGVAHDINNVLAAILGHASALQARAIPGTGNTLDTIVQASERGRDIVQRLLYFAHQPRAHQECVDLNALVGEAVHLLDATLLKHCRLVPLLAADLPGMTGDSGALLQAVMNLCLNAADAMPAGGDIVLRTRHDADGMLCLQVQDSGYGMPEDVAARALEPFFTTKPPGKGTGLGLPMVYGITTAHQGRLLIESQPCKGTTVSLYFPVRAVPADRPADAPLTAATPETPQPNTAQLGEQPSADAPTPDCPPTGACRILLVDDEPLVRESVSAMLAALGHQVQCADSGAAALEALTGDGPFDLVMLDHVMPGVNGQQTQAAIRLRWPQQRILMVSGHLASHHPAAPGDSGLTGGETLAKPFGLRELQQVLARILPGKPPAA